MRDRPRPTTPSGPRRWPPSPIGRIGIRALLGVPLALLGVWAVSEGSVSPAHRQLIAQTTAVLEDGFSFFDLGDVYPPAPILVAMAVGGSAVGLAVVSSMLAGTALHASWERMVQRDVPLLSQLAMIASVALVPSVWLLASQDVSTIGGLATLTVALAGFIRLVSDADTSGGFTAGLFLAAAFLFDPAAIAYALAMAAATPFLASERYFREPAATRALTSVLCFPIVAMLAGWAFLEWRFQGTPFTYLTTDLGLFQFEVSAVADLWTSAVEVAKNVAQTPVYVAVAVLLILRRPLAGLGFLIPVVGLVVVRWSGLFYSPTAALVLLTFIAMVSAPSGRSARWVIPFAAAAQLAVSFALPPDLPGFEAWMSLLSI